jgi:hypothetical protein
MVILYCTCTVVLIRAFFITGVPRYDVCYVLAVAYSTVYYALYCTALHCTAAHVNTPTPETMRVCCTAKVLMLYRQCRFR